MGVSGNLRGKRQGRRKKENLTLMDEEIVRKPRNIKISIEALRSRKTLGEWIEAVRRKELN